MNLTAQDRIIQMMRIHSRPIFTGEFSILLELSIERTQKILDCLCDDKKIKLIVTDEKAESWILMKP